MMLAEACQAAGANRRAIRTPAASFGGVVTQEAWHNRIVGSGICRAGDLQANEKNWRVHGKNQQDAMAGILGEVGWVQNIIVNRRTSPAWDGSQNVDTVVDGHMRAIAALRQGEETEVPVLYVDLDPQQEALVLATLDPIGAMAASDAAKLDELLRDVSTGDAALQAMLAELAENAGLYHDVPDDPGPQVDRAEELREVWGVQSGQLWEVPSKSVPGKAHRLLCGDSTKAEDVARLMQGEKAALMATDPPYNVGIAYGNESDDTKASAEYEEFTHSWFTLWGDMSTCQIVTPGCNNLARWLRWFDPYHVAPWIKTNAMTNGKVARWWCWEPILFFGDKWKRTRANDVFDFPVPPQKAAGMGSLTPFHPCPKPLPMWSDIVESYSEAGDLIAEAFNGSGTTLVAAEQTGRICFAVELEPKYVAVTLERLQGLGLEPRLLA